MKLRGTKLHAAYGAIAYVAELTGEPFSLHDVMPSVRGKCATNENVYVSWCWMVRAFVLGYYWRMARKKTGVGESVYDGVERAAWQYADNEYPMSVHSNDSGWRECVTNSLTNPTRFYQPFCGSIRAFVAGAKHAESRL